MSARLGVTRNLRGKPVQSETSLDVLSNMGRGRFIACPHAMRLVTRVVCAGGSALRIAAVIVQHPERILHWRRKLAWVGRAFNSRTLARFCFLDCFYLTRHDLAMVVSRLRVVADKRTCGFVI
jgi:hypothetical protein